MNRIKELRKARDIKQVDLAKAISVSQAALSGYETGKYEPDFDTLQKIAEYFSVTTDYLLGRDEKKPAAEDGSEPVVYEKLAKMLLEQGIDVGTLSDAQLQRLAKIIAAALEQ